MLKYPRIVTVRKTGAETIENTGPLPRPTLLDFWRWGFSNLVDNTTRGILAEFLVASALDVVTGTRSAWDAYDLRVGDLTIEVKTSAYLQTWGQNELSKIVFSIRPSRAYDADENTFESEVRRQAKVYVFCLLKHQNKDDTLNPLDASQWDFYVVRTADLDEHFPYQKSISLDGLLALQARRCSLADLRATIHLTIQNTLVSG